MRAAWVTMLGLCCAACPASEAAEHRVVDLATVAAPGSAAVPAADVEDTGAAEGEDGEGADNGSESEASAGDALVMSGKGSLPAEAAAATIQAGMGALQRCYAKERKRKPDVAGTVTAKIVVNRAGKVQAVKVVASTFPGKTMARCLVKLVKRWRFDKPSGGPVVVSYPFEFNPE